jgi:hypothetical protein
MSSVANYTNCPHCEGHNAIEYFDCKTNEYTLYCSDCRYLDENGVVTYKAESPFLEIPDLGSLEI